ncbi:MAG: hypothetical protein HY688_01035, partial [Chloroflexi bacterium]|nr:hypothetical protein [Chloroflexota bacterium]
VWGVLGIVAFLVVILVMVALFRLLAPLLRSLQATAANVQVTTTLVTEVIAKPLIRVASVYTGVRQGLRTLGRFLRRRR